MNRSICCSLSCAIVVSVAFACAGATASELAPSAAFMKACQAQLKPTKVRVVHPSSMPVEYDYSHSISQITSMARSGQAPAHHNEERVLGLTVSKSQYHAKVQGDALEDARTGLTCMRPQITVAISSGVQRVYVAREFPTGTCSHQAVSYHEMQHVAINEKVVMHVGGLAQQGMNRYFSQRILYGRKEQLVHQVLDQIQNQWLPWIKQNTQQMGQYMHAQIDTAEEKSKLTRMCGDEFQWLIRGAGTYTSP